MLCVKWRVAFVWIVFLVDFLWPFHNSGKASVWCRRRAEVQGCCFNVQTVFKRAVQTPPCTHFHVLTVVLIVLVITIYTLSIKTINDYNNTLPTHVSTR